MRIESLAKMIVVAFAASTFSNIAMAGHGIERLVRIDFTSAADMSIRAQEKLEKIINKRCQPAATVASGLSAKLMNTRSVRIDQGVIDVTYTVDVKFHGFEQYEAEIATVVLTDYAGANPSADWVQIDSITTTIDQLCR